jgi:hypothetical protein
MIQLKDIIQYYIGQKCFNTWFPEGHEQYDNGWVLTGVVASYPKPFALENEEDCTWTDSIKLILRRLEDMTEEEAMELAKIYSGADKIKRTTGTVNNFFYFFCDFRSGDKGTSEILIMHNGEAWYQHYFEDWPRRRTGRRNIVRQFDATHYLLKQGFDLWGLIERGEAVDQKTLNK